jgi:hypothetical protein
MFTVPPAVALINYTRSGIFWQIFSQTEIFAGFCHHIINQRSCDGAGAGNRFLGSLKGLQICALVAMGHNNTNAPLILKIRDIIFFYFGQTT